MNARIIGKYISGLPALKPRTAKKYWRKLPIIARKVTEQKGKTVTEFSKEELKR